MAVEGGGVKLRQDVDLADAAVDAVAHGHVNQAVSATNGHSRLGTLLGERVQAGTSTTTQNDSCISCRNKGTMS